MRGNFLISIGPWTVMSVRWAGIGLFVVMILACQDLTGSKGLPSHVIDPEIYKSPSGANQLASRARAAFQEAMSRGVIIGGLMTDELSSNSLLNPYTVPHYYLSIDRRVIADPHEDNFAIRSTYEALHETRGYSMLAREYLWKYDSKADSLLLSELLVFQAYSEIYLADLFCSGIPLSKIIPNGDYEYAPQSTTRDVYRSAISLLDTAIILADTNVHISSAAKIGKARALLSIGDYLSSDSVLSGIDVQYSFQFYSALAGDGRNLTVSDKEGKNGYPYLASADSRVNTTKVTPSGIAPNPYYWPAKYAAGGSQQLVLASGIEAQLIRAELALLAGKPGVWLGTLNDLRSLEGLSSLVDPVDSIDRIKMLLSERAAWLFVTGHRQSDLRRVVRNYGISQDKVYPTGGYASTYLSYGMYTNLSIPEEERSNPLFNRCLDRDA